MSVSTGAPGTAYPAQRSGATIARAVGKAFVSTILAAAFIAVAAPDAGATNRLYWTNFAVAQTISFVNLDGSGSGGTVNTTGAPAVTNPAGVGIDPSAGKVYWANLGTGTISFANLDGSGGGGMLNTSPIGPDEPAGVALDAASGKIYWADRGDDRIEFANLDGSGGGMLSTGSLPPNQPEGVAVDPATGKIYWADSGDDQIEFANLDGSGGGATLETTGVTVNKPIGVAIDPATGRIYWANSATSGTDSNTIEFANLNDTGDAGILNTSPAPVDNPQGVAVDPGAGKVYWANFDGASIDSANVDGGGGATIDTSGEIPAFPVFPALLDVPSGTGAPTVTGGSAAPTTLSCSQGSWGPDQPESLLYQAPQSFSFSWTDNGAAIPGATASSLAVSSGGSYSCHVTANNQAGSTVQTSAPFAVGATLAVGATSVSGKTATLTLTCEGASGQECSGDVVGSTRERKRASTILGVTAKHRSRSKKAKVRTVTVTVAETSYNAAGGQTVKLRVSLNKTGARLLSQFYRLPVALTFSGSVSEVRNVTYSYARLHPSIDAIWATTSPCTSCYTQVRRLALSGLTSHEKVQARCHGGGCPFGQRTPKRRGSRLALTGMFGGAHLATGTSVEILVTASNSVGWVRIYTMVAGNLPKTADRCLPPGDRRPAACA